MTIYIYYWPNVCAWLADLRGLNKFHCMDSKILSSSAGHTKPTSSSQNEGGHGVASFQKDDWTSNAFYNPFHQSILLYLSVSHAGSAIRRGGR